MEWLVPICLFWTLIAMYLGGWPVEVVGGGAVRQLTGTFNSFILYLAFWGGLRALLGGMGGLLWGVVLPTVIATLALPVLVWGGFMIMGVRVQKGESPH